MSFYRNESSNHKWNAQRSLSGRTHYVDDDTLRFHKSRIIYTTNTDNGLLFALIESVGLDMNNTKRGFRFVVFDVFGTVLERATLADSYTTSDKARKAMWSFLDTVDAKAHTLAELDRQQKAAIRELDDLRVKVNALGIAKSA